MDLWTYGVCDWSDGEEEDLQDTERLLRQHSGCAGPWRLFLSPVEGRGLAAQRAQSAGDLLLRDPPLVLAPLRAGRAPRGVPTAAGVGRARLRWSVCACAAAGRAVAGLGSPALPRPAGGGAPAGGEALRPPAPAPRLGGDGFGNRAAQRANAEPAALHAARVRSDGRERVRGERGRARPVPAVGHDEQRVLAQHDARLRREPRHGGARRCRHPGGPRADQLVHAAAVGHAGATAAPAAHQALPLSLRALHGPPELSGDQLSWKEAACGELLALLRQLRAGRTRLTGLLLLELSCTLEEKLRRQQGEADAALQAQMESYLRDAASVFAGDVTAPPELWRCVAAVGRKLNANEWSSCPLEAPPDGQAAVMSNCCT
ncbi:uncharacterized protein LOC126088214 [Schistocerca cancellata]|uniref:uncharacterized protein LOC126088214 n=1 Tax=Schistocerca cancellata TaxID=274614 RepID=UPI002117C5EB|nr:uncharacterized protein LOC126088214 [Schistocerca cancellata]